MLKKVRIFPITSYSADGYPVYGTPTPLLTIEEGETEVNNIRFKLTPSTKVKTLNADDREETHTAVVGFNFELEAYGIDATALAAITSGNKDKNGNVNHTVNTGSEKYVGIFLEGKNEKGSRFQQWIYKCLFNPIDEENTTQSDTPTTITLTGSGSVINAGGKDRTHATVYEGNTGWVAGEPSASNIYKEPSGV